MSENFSQQKLGILGGGQLGRMLLQKAIDFNIDCYTLDPDENAPCRFISKFTHGSFNDYQTVMNFGKDKDVITIEIEHVNIQALKELEASGKKVFPQPHIIEMVQDKGLQKEFYEKHNLPTAPFSLVDSKSEISQHENKFPLMQKLLKGGYDGKGVYKIKSSADLNSAFDAPSVLESLIDFEKEISVIVARNVSGEVKTFPAVDMDFNPEANLVEFLFSPADISSDVEKKAKDIAIQLVNELKLVGILAVEFFVTKQGEVLINEIAPRPHNSGHHTIEANYTSQYEQHLRCILNLDLGSTAIVSPAVMMNVLGEKNHEGIAVYNGLDTVMKTEGASLHLYGKQKTKPFRKMGHITVLAPTVDEARKKAKAIKNKFRVES